jgi:hypothetical protein
MGSANVIKQYLHLSKGDGGGEYGKPQVQAPGISAAGQAVKGCQLHCGDVARQKGVDCATQAANAHVKRVGNYE